MTSYSSICLLMLLAIVTSLASAEYGKGAQQMIYVRVDFEDMPGAPVGLEEAQETMTELDTFIRANSQGQAWVEAEFTDVIRMPQKASLYKTFGVLALRNAVWSWLGDQGRALDEFDVIIIAFGDDPVDINGSSAADGGSGNVMLGGHFGWDILAHEVGHAYGLSHANRWKTKNGSPIDPSSSGSDYGDKFDVMGNGKRQEHHFSAWSKHRMRWVDAEDVPMVTSSGRYRIAAHDHPDATGIRALQLERLDGEQVYWISYRSLIDDLSGGVQLQWELNPDDSEVPDTDSDAYLIDATPETNSIDDSALSWGESLVDNEAEITITAVELDESGPFPVAVVDISLGDEPPPPPPLEPHRLITWSVMQGGTEVAVTASIMRADGSEADEATVEPVVDGPGWQASGLAIETGYRLVSEPVTAVSARTP